MRRSLFRPAAVLALSGGLILGTALPALAHHPELSGSVACTGGQQIITWTVRNSETTTGTNRTMTLDQVSVTSGTVVGLAVGAAFPPKPMTGSTKTATTTRPGTQTGSVTLAVRGDWNNGGPQNIVQTVSVTLPGQCTVPTTTTTVPPTTTTTVPPTTTTTVPPTTTTTTTTTTAPPTTTTTAPPTTTTTTAPPTTTTTAPPTTTTTAPPTTTTTAPTTTEPPTTTTTAPTTTSTAPTTTSTVQTQVLGETLTKPAGPQVLAEQVTAPNPPLAHTGAAVGLLAFLGGGLLWIGVPLTRYKRRPNKDENAEG